MINMKRFSTKSGNVFLSSEIYPISSSKVLDVMIDKNRSRTQSESVFQTARTDLRMISVHLIIRLESARILRPCTVH